MSPCTHSGMKRLFCLRQKPASVASFSRPCLIASREVNEARGPHTCSRPCAFEVKKTKNKRNPTTHITHHEIHSSPATATNSKRRATKNFPRVSPYSHASIDPGFVEIGHVQLSQSVKTTRPKDTCTTLLTCQLAAGRRLRDANPV